MSEPRAAGATADEDDDKIPDLSHVTPAYKRALWIVVLLNIGYGMVEIVGSFLAGSQALQADSLDFIGDGLISFLGLMAVGWGLAARAKAALLQGIFLALLGLGVIGSTAYRVFVEHEPQTLLMGGFALVAFFVNVAAALVLIPHRKGDANMRAVWLFSRNDAIGNLAVVVAAVLVWWFSSPWPDLVVAFAVAGLFLQSARTGAASVRAGAAVSLVVFGSAFDLAGKAWARAALEPYAAPLDFLPLVSLRLSFNEGVSFSMFASESEGARLGGPPLATLAARRLIADCSRCLGQPDRPGRARLGDRLPGTALRGMVSLCVQPR